MCINLKILTCTKWFIVKYILFLLWILTLFFVYCKLYNVYFDEPEYEQLTKILGYLTLTTRTDVPSVYKVFQPHKFRRPPLFQEPFFQKTITDERKGLCISRITAPVIYFLVAVTILPVCRTFNKMVHKMLRRISLFCLTFYLEKVKVLHMALSTGLVLIAVVHVVTHVINAMNYVTFYDWQHHDLNWAMGTNDSFARLVFATPTGFSGCVMLVALILMWVTSTRSIRHYFYNCYLAAHHLCLLMVWVLLYFHPLSNIIKFQKNIELECSHDANSTSSNDNCHNKEIFSAGERKGWIWPSIGLFIYLTDAFIRSINRNSNDVVVHNAQKFPGKAVFLRIALKKTTLNVRPGQYILLQCLNISSLEWHPFTVTKIPSSTDSTFTLLIATRGDWTLELYRKVTENTSFQKNQTICKTYHVRPPLKFLIDGPFPSPLESIFQHKITYCVAGGVGVTPFIAFLNELLHKLENEPSRIHLIWVVTHVEHILWFSEIFEQLMEKLWEQNAPDRLDIQIYVTKNFNAQKISKYFHQTNSFLKSRIRSGRPNWCSQFTYLDFLYQKQEVAVFSSGPKGLNQEIQKICHDKNKIGYNYWFLHQGFH